MILTLRFSLSRLLVDSGWADWGCDDSRSDIDRREVASLEPIASFPDFKFPLVFFAAPIAVAHFFCMGSDVVAQPAPLERRNESPVEGAAGVNYFSGNSHEAALAPGSMPGSMMVRHADETPPADKKAFLLNEEGVELVFKGHRDEGRRKLEEALVDDPRNPTVLYNLAGLELANSNPAAAIDLMNRAIELRPTDLAFLNRMAEAHFAKSDLPGAIEYYEKIVKIDPGYEETLLRLGTIYGMTKQWEAAEKTLRHAAEIHPKDVRTLSNFGNILVLREKFPEAAKVLERAQHLKPLPESAVALGIAYEGGGDKARALQNYRIAEELGNKDPELKKHIEEISESVSSAATSVHTEPKVDH